MLNVETNERLKQNARQYKIQIVYKIFFFKYSTREIKATEINK